RDDSDNPEYQALLAQSHFCLGNVYGDTGPPAKAAEEYQQAIAGQEKLARKHPDVLDYAARLGLSYSSLGNTVRDSVKPQDGLSWFAKAVETLQRVLEVEPRHTQAQEFLASTRVGRALAYAMMGDYGRALQDAEELKAHPPDGPDALYNLGCAYALCAT